MKQEAKALAQELNASKKMTPEQQAAVVALAQRVEDMKLTRGAKFGPHCYWNRLQPGKKDTYKLKFNPDKLARIMAQADTKVRLEVRNSDGDRRGIDAGKHPQTGFVPHNPRDFTITVKNEGHQATFYRIFTN